ncbi:hypothetical protein ABZ442_28010 [Streptomyces triculaminicus]|uniref:hypothetical protein n=1 Tax=Streptomyces triculaminicus TaxID=2816232 RepID=UPI0033CC3E16
MSGAKEPSPSTGPTAPGLDETQAAVGKRLDDVAKILAGALVAVAGIMTTLGLNSRFVFVALNNRSWPIYVASLCAIIAIVCSDDEGEVAQRIDIPLVPPAGTSVVAVSAVNPDRSTEEKCEITSQHGPACTELHLS